MEILQPLSMIVVLGGLFTSTTLTLCWCCSFVRQSCKILIPRTLPTWLCESRLGFEHIGMTAPVAVGAGSTEKKEERS